MLLAVSTAIPVGAFNPPMPLKVTAKSQWLGAAETRYCRHRLDFPRLRSRR